MIEGIGDRQVEEMSRRRNVEFVAAGEFVEGGEGGQLFERCVGEEEVLGAEGVDDLGERGAVAVVGKQIDFGLVGVEGIEIAVAVMG